MKPLKFISLLTLTSLTLASSTFAFGATSEEVAQLSKVLKGHTMSCSPVGKEKPSDPNYKGDEGFFKVRITKGDVEVFDNGGSGFGFANGDVRDLHVGSEDLFLSVGDDGYQILTLHNADFGTETPNCAEGRIISYFDGFHSGGDKLDSLKCCLE